MVKKKVLLELSDIKGMFHLGAITMIQSIYDISIIKNNFVFLLMTHVIVCMECGFKDRQLCLFCFP